MLRTCARASAVILLGVIAVAPGLPSGAQTGSTPEYTYYLAHGQADGMTATFTIDALLPVDELVGLSSVTSESHFGVGRSDSLAALPDPGDLVLTLPGTLAALTGISGLPDYPAASRSEYPSIPADDVQLVPDAGLGAGKLHTEATDQQSAASAELTGFRDLVGLLPAFSIGSVATNSTTRRLDDVTFEATATTTLSDIRLLGGLVRIDQITSVATTQVLGSRLTSDASEVTVSGAQVAGQPVGITKDGIVALGQAEALQPVIDVLTKPLRDLGLGIKTTGATQSVEDGKATATAGTLEITMPLTVSGRSGAFVLALGTASASLEVGGGAAVDSTSGAAGPVTGAAAPTGGAGTSALPTNRPASSPSPSPARPSGDQAPAEASGNGQRLITLPGRQVQRWDVRSLYRAMAAAGLVMLLGRWLLLHLERRMAPAAQTKQLRQLWRW